MKKTRGLIIFALFLFVVMCLVPSNLLAYDSSKEEIVNFQPDTGDMNERPADRKFRGTFTVKTKSTDANDYKVDGSVKDIKVAVYASWQNNSSYTRVYQGSFTPVDSSDNVVSSKDFSFAYQNPDSWTNPMRVIVIAQFNNTPSSSPQTSYTGRGDIENRTVETPPPLQDVALGTGSTYYEGLQSFDGSLGEVDPVTGNVNILMTVLVRIYRNPLGGAYDPTPEGIGVFADLNGGTNPTTRIYGETKLAGAYWRNNGIEPTLPFDLPFYGSWQAGPNIPGVIVGGPAMAWGSVPVLGSNCTWGEQNRVVWYLPPRSINFTPDLTPKPGYTKPTFEIFDGYSFGASAQVILRALQVQSRVGGFSWNWGDGSSDTQDMISGKMTSHRTHVYTLVNPSVGVTYHGNCNVNYQNSTNNQTNLQYPFDVIVKPLPRIHVPTTISIRNSAGSTVAIPGEDVTNTYIGLGSQDRITCEGYEYNYQYKFKFNDGVELIPSPANQVNPRVSRMYSVLGHKWVQLWVHYRKGAIEGGVFKDKGWVDECIATKYFDVESQQLMENDAAQRITFTVTPDGSSSAVTITSTDDIIHSGYKCMERTLTTTSPTSSIRFTASANIFYARRDENADYSLLDEKSGVKPGSVYYRWRILDADNNDALEKGYVTVSNQNLVKNFTNISGTGTTISPLTVTFNTPFGNTLRKNRYYKVFIEAKYKELRWKPVYGTTSYNSTGKIIGWTEDATYLNNSKTRYIAYSPCRVCTSGNIWTTLSDVTSNNANNPTTASDFTSGDIKLYSSGAIPPLTKESKGGASNEDLLRDGSLGWLVRIKDEIPAKITLNETRNGSLLSSGFTNIAFTGDPLYHQVATYALDVVITDNNPDAIASYVEIIYNRYDEPTNKMVSMISAISDFNISNDRPNLYTSKTQGNFTTTRASLGSQKIFNSRKAKINGLKAKEANENRPFVISSLKKYNEIINTPLPQPAYNQSGNVYRTSYVALYSAEYERFANSFATTMKTPLLCTVGNEGKYTYYAKGYVDDGVKHWIQTANRDFSVKDNDVPNVKITLVDPESGVPTIYEISGGFNDPQRNPSPKLATLTRKITRGTSVLSSTAINENDSGDTTTINAPTTFNATANQRFLCNIEVFDNVLPKTNTDITIESYIYENSSQKDTTHPELKEYATGIYKSENPYYAFFMKPGSYTLKFVVTQKVDASGAVKKIVLNVPLNVQREREANIRILRQEHEK